MTSIAKQLGYELYDEYSYDDEKDRLLPSEAELKELKRLLNHELLQDKIIHTPELRYYVLHEQKDSYGDVISKKREFAAVGCQVVTITTSISSYLWKKFEIKK